MTDNYEKRHRANIRQWFKQNIIDGLQGAEPTEADYQRYWNRVWTPPSEVPVKAKTPAEWFQEGIDARRVREQLQADSERLETERVANLTPMQSNAEIARMWRDLKRSQLVEAENKPHLRGSVPRKRKDLKDAEARLAEAELNIDIERRQTEMATAVGADDDVRLAATLVESGILGNAPGSDERFAYLLLQKKLANASSIDDARAIAEEVMQHERTATMARLAAKRKAEAAAIQSDAPVSEVERLRADRVAVEEQALKLIEGTPANPPKPSSYTTLPDPIDGALQTARRELFENHGKST